MFRQAIATARAFTNPVVMNAKRVDGSCFSAMGTFVLLNDEGWILTAAHIIREIMALEEAGRVCRNRAAELDRIAKDDTLGAKEKYDLTKKCGKTRPEDVELSQEWWHDLGTNIEAGHLIPEVDLAIAKLGNFKAPTGAIYPTIKDPGRGVTSGVSLCRLGFPFHAVGVSWKSDKNMFWFDDDALPLPLFPLEGMFTREVYHPQGASPYRLWSLETSSPGLKGQSGGPIFDTQGTVWSIQAATLSLPLGFEPEVPGSGGRREHQFLNVGIGVHPATLCAALDSLGVKYNKSNY